MSSKKAGLMTFSEEEDKLYADGFDPLYMAENDKKPVPSPHSSQSDEDQVKPTKKTVCGASDESENDLNDKEPVPSPHSSQSDEDQVNPTKKNVFGASDESENDLNDKEPLRSPLFSQSDDDQKVKPTKRSVGTSDEPKDDLNFDNKSFVLYEAKAGQDISPLHEKTISSESDADHEIDPLEKHVSLAGDENKELHPTDSSGSSYVSKSVSYTDDDDLTDTADKRDVLSADDDDQHDLAAKNNASAVDDDDQPDAADKSDDYSANDDDQPDPADKIVASLAVDDDQPEPADKIVASLADDDDQPDPADKIVVSLADDDDQPDPADKIVVSESFKSKVDSRHPSGKKRQFSSKSGDNRCHLVKKSKIMPKKTQKIHHVRSNSGSDIELEVAKAESLFDLPPITNKRNGETLHATEINEIESGWLSTKTINASMELLRQHSPSLGALYNCQWGQTLEYEAANSSKWIQILHNGTNHWLLACKGFDSEASDLVLVYDSSISGDSPGQHVIYCIAQITQTEKKYLKLGLMDCEQQRDSSSCGLYAIAFATALVFGMNPAELRFDLPKMRPHLMDCLRSSSIRPFPTVGTRVRSQWRPKKICSFPVYCVCRLPDGDTKFPKYKVMAQCNKCKNYFHQYCLNIPQCTIDSRKMPWSCIRCA